MSKIFFFSNFADDSKSCSTSVDAKTELEMKVLNLQYEKLGFEIEKLKLESQVLKKKLDL